MTGSPDRLCRALGIERPVIQAPMTGFAGGALAAAVSAAGGLGMIATGHDEAGYRAEGALARPTPVGAGVLTFRLDHTFLSTVLDQDPSTVWLSFGDPTPFVAPIQRRGATVICQVGTLAEAQVAVDAGADVIAVQGQEAGGHGRSGRPATELLGQVRAALPGVPLALAGGVSDRGGYQRAVDSGADGVVVGTAFYATHEALDTQAAKQRLVECTGADTVRSRVYDTIRGSSWPDGIDGRTLRSVLTDRWAGREHEIGDHRIALQKRHEQAEQADDVALRVIWAGMGIDGVDRIEAAADVTRRFPSISPIPTTTVLDPKGRDS